MAKQYAMPDHEIAQIITDVQDKLNAFAHPQLLALQNNNDKITTAPMRWGIIPTWVKSREQALEIQNKTLNARAESIFEKASFKSAILTNRCALPVDSFFEYQHKGKEKILYEIHSTTDSPLLLAGIYEIWISPRTRTPVVSCSIVTCQANATMAEIHNSKLRMPVILSDESISTWLAKETTPAVMQSLMQPCPDYFLRPDCK